MKTSSLLRRFAVLAGTALLLAACGGGGGDDAPSSPFGSSASFEGSVAGCEIETQKKFVRAYMDEVYLWYREIPQVDAASFSSVEDYFHALRVRTPDVNGLPKDRWSAVLPTSQVRDVLQSLGMQQLDATTLLSTHTNAVPQVSTDVGVPGRKVGYLQFDDHVVGAQDDLITAFTQLRNAGVQDLILDLRRNSGGFLYVALTAASLVTGPANDGKVFEQLQFNDKRAAESSQSTLFFRSTVQFADGPSAQYDPGTALPQLNLPRVFVLTTGTTCSASESIINSLRGIDVQVIRIGTTTCGKPFGFRQKNNCGLAFFPIEFQGRNAKGFGDFTAGFGPQCEVQDSTRTVPIGQPGDPLLEAAKFYIQNNQCQPGTATGIQSAALPIVMVEQPRRPSWAGRVLLPEQQR